MSLHNIDHARRLFVINCGEGVTCLGFDVAYRRSLMVANWLWVPVHTHELGTAAAFDDYERLMALAVAHNLETGDRCVGELTPELCGFEGKRVEIVDCAGDRRRFVVGRSTGWCPAHLEISRRSAIDDVCVTGTPFRSVRVI